MSEESYFQPSLVLHASNPGETVAFYSEIGLVFHEERHGRGPLHYAAPFGGMVIEVYPSSGKPEPGNATELVFPVDDVGSRVSRMRARGFAVEASNRKKVGGSAVVRDPDGRRVLFIQKQ